jgi:hypothetical protein
LIFAFKLRDGDYFLTQAKNILIRSIESGVKAKIQINDFSGNPLMGFTCSRLELLSGDRIIASAGQIHIYPSVSSLLILDPMIDRITAKNLKIDGDSLAKVLIRTSEGVTPFHPYFHTIRVRDLSLSYQGESLLLDSGKLHFSERPGCTQIKGELQGTWRGNELDLEGLTLIRSGDIEVELSESSWGETRFSGKGKLYPNPILSGNVENAQLSELLRIGSPYLARSVKGGLDSSLSLKGSWSNLRLSGNGMIKAGVLWGVPVRQGEGCWEWHPQGNRFFTTFSGARLFAETAATGAVSVDWTGQTRLRARGVLSRGSLAPFANLIPAIRGISGTLNTLSLDLEGSLSSPRGALLFDVKDMAHSGEKFQRLQGTVTIRSADLGANATGTWYGLRFGIQGNLRSRDGMLAGTGILLDSPLTSLPLRFPKLKGQPLTGRIKGTFGLSGFLSDPTYRVNLACPVLTYRGEALSNLTLAARGSKRNLNVETATAALLGGSFALSGNVLLPTKGGSPMGSGALNFRFSTFSGTHLASRLPKGWTAPRGFSAQGIIKGNLDSPRIDFRAAMPILTGEGLSLNGIALEGTGYPSTRRGEGLHFTAGIGGSGILQGDGRVALPSEGSPSLEARGTFSGVDPSKLGKELPSGIPSGRYQGSFTVRGTAQDPQWTLTASLPETKLEGITVKNLTFGADSSPQGPRLRSLSGQAFGGTFLAGGSIRASAKKDEGIPLDVSGSIASLDMGAALAQVAPALPLRGRASGSFKISGSSKDPRYVFDGTLIRLGVSGLYFPSAKVRLEGDSTHVRIPKIRATLGTSSAQMSLNAEKGKNGWEASFSGRGEDLSLKDLSLYQPQNWKGQLEGQFSFGIRGSLGAKGIAGEGSVSLPSLKAAGFRATDLVVPFFLSGKYLVVEDAQGKAYGGPLFAQYGRDLTSTHYGGRLEVRSFDLGNALAETLAKKKIAGKITGRSDFSLHIQGDSKRSNLNDGEGYLRITDGEISGSTSASAVAAVTGNKPIRFRSLLGSYNIDGKTLYLLPGSRIAATPGQPAFKFLMADGSLGLASGSLDLSCYGNVNIRALNAYVGAVQGLIGSAMDTQSLLKNFLGGLVKGFAKKDFRDVSFNLKGSLGKPTLTDLKIERSILKETSPIPAEASDSKNVDNTDFRIQIRIPVGPGAGNGDSPGISDQIMEQTINQILIQGLGNNDGND